MNQAQKTKMYYKLRGMEIFDTEMRHPKSHVKKDLFGLFDFVVLGSDHPIGVQATSASNFLTRKKKILNSDNLELILKAGFEIVLHGWADGDDIEKNPDVVPSKIWKKTSHITVDGS